MKNRWVLTTKYRLDDIVEREKARLVVKGFTQVCGADYDETYSPVSSYATLRIFLSIVAVLDLNLMQLDMKNAFLQSKFDRVLYMDQPNYFDDGTGRVCKLLKSLYGLKQSPLLWYRALDGVLQGAGWKKCQVDEALYFKASDNGVTCWVLAYVDDLLAASSSPAMLKELKELLEDAFELREISPGYADKLRRRFIDEEQGSRVPKTPVTVDAYAELTFDDEEAQEQEEEEYRQKVGSLQFAATTMRPDIGFACSKLGSGLTVRRDQHWREVDRCLAYLADTRDTALEFSSGPESLELIGYVDADDAGDKQKRMSTSVYAFVYKGAAVSWSSSCIKCATLSSTGSEYVAATNVGKEGRRLRFLLAEFKLLDAGKPTILRVDNKSAITVAAGLGLTGNLKHMERRYAWLQHMVRRGKFVLMYIPTTEQPADFSRLIVSTRRIHGPPSLAFPARYQLRAPPRVAGRRHARRTVVAEPSCAVIRDQRSPAALQPLQLRNVEPQGIHVEDWSDIRPLPVRPAEWRPSHMQAGRRRCSLCYPPRFTPHSTRFRRPESLLIPPSPRIPRSPRMALPHARLVLHWKATKGRTINMAVVASGAKAGGWFAVGFSPNGGMSGSNAIATDSSGSPVTKDLVGQSSADDASWTVGSGSITQSGSKVIMK
ncbi:unnamed protein product [Closterium sp. NIES-54]